MIAIHFKCFKEQKRKRPGSNVYAGLSRSEIKETRRASRFDVDLSTGGEGSILVAGRWSWMRPHHF